MTRNCPLDKTVSARNAEARKYFLAARDGRGAEVGVEWVNWIGGEPSYSSEVLVGYRMRGPGFTMPLSVGAALTGTPRTPRFRGSAGALIRRRAN